MSTRSSTGPTTIQPGDGERVPDAGEATPPGVVAGVAVLIVAAVVLQRPGEIIMLTRLDRVLDPVSAALGSFTLWDPLTDMGSVQFQTIGYLFMHDLPFAVFGWLGVPVWLAERLLIAVVPVVGLWGFVRLADRLGAGRPATRIIGGLAFALSPVILARVGWRLPEALAPALLPWVLLPLVRGARMGSPRVAAARSGVAVALMGGANAAVVLSVLPAAVLFLLTRQRGPRRVRLAAWWALSVFLATAWWMVGLVFYARYGPDLLVLSEDAGSTTGVATPWNVLRGSADWLVSLGGGEYLPAASQAARRFIPLVGLGIVTALGLGGLALRGMPERRFLVSCLVVGVMATAGATVVASPWLANPLAGTYLEILSGPLNAFRNVYKFSGLVALPLAMGVTHLLGRMWLPAPARHLRAVAAGALAVAVLAVVAGAYPLVTGNLVRGPGFAAEPAAWLETKAFLAGVDAQRVLVLPGQAEASYEWGLTEQHPLQWGTDVASATRNQVPLGGPRTIAFLDVVERAVERGGDPGLPAFLAAGGFSHVVVPNDTRDSPVAGPPPERVAEALEDSGLVKAAAFGPGGFGFGDLSQVEIWDVPGSEVVAAYPMADAAWLSGDTDDVLALREADFGNRAYILTADGAPGSVELDNWVITDGNQRVARALGLPRNNRSGVLYANETGVGGRSVAGSRLLNDSVENQTTLSFAGVASMTASSVGPGPFSWGLSGSQVANAFDGDPRTSWRPREFTVGGPGVWGGEDPWLEVSFPEPRDVSPLTITLDAGPFRFRVPVRVIVATDGGEASTLLAASTDPQVVNVPPGPTTRLRITIDEESFLQGGDWLGIAEVSLPGPPLVRRLRTPAELIGEFSRSNANVPAWVFTRMRPSRSPIVDIDTEAALAREFTVPRATTVDLRATASLGRPGELVALLGMGGPLGISAREDSLVPLRLQPRNLIDGDPTTRWRTLGSTDPDQAVVASLFLEWEGDRTIDRLQLGLGDDIAVPSLVTVVAGDEVRLATVGADGLVTFEPVTASDLQLVLAYPAAGDDDPLPVGLDSLVVPALGDLYPEPLDDATIIAVPCGEGPTITVGGVTRQYRASVPLGTLLDRTPFDLEPCDPAGVALEEGATTLDATNGPYGITVDQVVLGAPPLLSPDAGTPRPLEVTRWEATERRINVGAGASALLAVTEVANPGWQATLNGTPLDTLTIDGWRQGFVVPAGDGGEIALVYAPNRWYRSGTIAGLGLLALLMGLAVVPARNRRQLPPLGEGQWWAPLTVAVALLAAVWMTGVLALALLPLWWLVKRRPLVAVALSAGGFLLATAVVAVARRSSPPWVRWFEVGAFPVAVLVGVAFLAVVASVLPYSTTGRTSADADVPEEAPSPPGAPGTGG